MMKMSKKRKMMIGVTMAILYSLSFLITQPTTSTADSTNFPSQNGDWIVNTTTYVDDKTIVLNGNLIIKNNGNLTLNNITLLINCTYDGEYYIEVQDGGSLYIYNSNITAVNISCHYLFWVRNRSNFEMKNSELHECGYEPETEYTDYLLGLVVETDGIIIKNCIISNNYVGIILYSSFNIIKNNHILYNHIGVLLSASNNITRNNISNNWCGVWACFPGSKNNHIYCNNFINNTNHAWDDGRDNYWDNGVNGNFWSNYPCSDADNDGIGEIPYHISSSPHGPVGAYEGKDNFPLMEPFDIIFPSSSIKITGTTDANGWYISNATVSITATDTWSGVKKIYYRINNGSWQEYLEAFIINADGTYVIEYYSIDNADNIEETKSSTVKIAVPPPEEPKKSQSKPALIPGFEIIYIIIILSGCTALIGRRKNILNKKEDE